MNTVTRRSNGLYSLQQRQTQDHASVENLPTQRAPKCPQSRGSRVLHPFSNSMSWHPSLHVQTSIMQPSHAHQGLPMGRLVPAAAHVSDSKVSAAGVRCARTNSRANLLGASNSPMFLSIRIVAMGLGWATAQLLGRALAWRRNHFVMPQLMQRGRRRTPLVQHGSLNCTL
jgi:hypothetical protein